MFSEITKYTEMSEKTMFVSKKYSNWKTIKRSTQKCRKKKHQKINK